MTHEDSGPTFEVEAATVEEFLRLLKEREEGEASLRGSRSATRRAVFIAQIFDRRSSSYGYPSVRRYVAAAFAYGRDLVTYRRTTSSAVELPQVAEKTAQRQREVYEEIRTEIERTMQGMGLDVPVYEGSLRHPADPSEN